MGFYLELHLLGSRLGQMGLKAYCPIRVTGYNGQVPYYRMLPNRASDHIHLSDFFVGIVGSPALPSSNARSF